MKKVILPAFAMAILAFSLSSFTASTAAVIPPDDGGATSCTSMPTNNGHCHELSVNGKLGYYCLSTGTGCLDCIK